MKQKDDKILIPEDADAGAKELPQERPLDVRDFIDPNPYIPKGYEGWFPNDPIVRDALVMVIGGGIVAAVVYPLSFVFPEFFVVVVLVIGLMATVGDFYSRFNVASLRFYRKQRELKKGKGK